MWTHTSSGSPPGGVGDEEEFLLRVHRVEVAGAVFKSESVDGGAEHRGPERWYALLVGPGPCRVWRRGGRPRRGTWWLHVLHPELRRRLKLRHNRRSPLGGRIGTENDDDTAGRRATLPRLRGDLAHAAGGMGSDGVGAAARLQSRERACPGTAGPSLPRGRARADRGSARVRALIHLLHGRRHAVRQPRDPRLRPVESGAEPARVRVRDRAQGVSRGGGPRGGGRSPHGADPRGPLGDDRSGVAAAGTRGGSGRADADLG